MASMPHDAIQAPNVPPSTMRNAGMLMNAAGEVPSMTAPPRRPTAATAIPIAVAAFMTYPGRSSAVCPRSSPERHDPGRVGPLERVGQNAHAPAGDLVDDLLHRLDDDDPVSRGQHDRRVGDRLDRHDEVGVELEGLVALAESVELDHQWLLAVEVDQVLEHLVGRGDHARAGLEAALRGDHGRELRGEVDVRHLDGARRRGAEDATLAGGVDGLGAGVGARAPAVAGQALEA